jgi:hypothetical protein
MRASLPWWVLQIVGNPPISGEGFHRWLFRAALALIRCGRPDTDVVAVLENAAAFCGRKVPVSELQEAITGAHRVSENGSRASHPPTRWPAQNQKRIEAIREEGALVDLWETSPVQLQDDVVCAEAIIDILFPGNPLLCVGKHNWDFQTLHREEWRGKLPELQFIVPSPMSARYGYTKERKRSQRTLDNTGPRRFLVVEFDTGSLDEHAARLLHLAESAPLALVVYSGGKSLHGWFYCQGHSEEKILKFMSYAIALGADPVTWNRVQAVRLPDGRRNNGNRQGIVFFNPGVIK